MGQFDSLRQDRSGYLERPTTSSDWSVPDDVWIDRDNLVWTPTDGRQVQCGPGMLESFVGLHKKDEKIANYARRWGPLYLENGVFEVDDFGTKKNWRLNVLRRGPKGRVTRATSEPLLFWRYWSEQFWAALHVASAFDAGERPGKTIWMNMLSKAGFLDEWLHGETSNQYSKKENRFFMFNWLLHDWFELSGLRLDLEFADVCVSPDQPRIHRLEIRTPNLFAGLVLQLLAAVSGAGGFAICCACQETYTPNRQPRSGERNYCQKQACRRIQNALKQRRHRALGKKLTLADSLAAKGK